MTATKEIYFLHNELCKKGFSKKYQYLLQEVLDRKGAVFVCGLDQERSRVLALEEEKGVDGCKKAKDIHSNKGDREKGGRNRAMREG